MNKLKNRIQAQLDITERIINEYPWRDPKAYGMWLAQTYYMVSHSTRLVALAGACVSLEKSSLHARFVDHSKEERGHEKVCVADIKALGYELKDFPQTYQSASMYQVQYYWVQHRDPVSFFGYTLALECLAERFGPRVGALVYEAHGAKATRFLKLHSEDDVEHTESAMAEIAKLDESDLKLVEENLVLSSEIYRGMLSASMEWALKHSQTKKVA